MHHYHSRPELHVRIGRKGGKKIDPGKTFKQTRARCYLQVVKGSSELNLEQRLFYLR